MIFFENVTLIINFNNKSENSSELINAAYC